MMMNGKMQMRKKKKKNENNIKFFKTKHTPLFFQMFLFVTWLYNIHLYRK